MKFGVKCELSKIERVGEDCFAGVITNIAVGYRKIRVIHLRHATARPAYSSGVAATKASRSDTSEVILSRISLEYELFDLLTEHGLRSLERSFSCNSSLLGR